MMNEDFKAKATININASKEKVWEALVTPEIIKKYFFGTDVVSDWKVGGPIVYKGEWEGKPYEDPGTILALESGKLLEINHRSGKDPDVAQSYHKVSFGLEPEGENIKVTITQDNNKNEEEKKNSEQMWNMLLESLKKLLEK